jgi:hypothetical protein
MRVCKPSADFAGSAEGWAGSAGDCACVTEKDMRKVKNKRTELSGQKRLENLIRFTTFTPDKCKSEPNARLGVNIILTPYYGSLFRSKQVLLKAVRGDQGWPLDSLHEKAEYHFARSCDVIWPGNRWLSRGSDSEERACFSEGIALTI